MVCSGILDVAREDASHCGQNIQRSKPLTGPHLQGAASLKSPAFWSAAVLQVGRSHVAVVLNSPVVFIWLLRLPVHGGTGSMSAKFFHRNENVRLAELVLRVYGRRGELYEPQAFRRRNEMGLAGARPSGKFCPRRGNPFLWNQNSAICAADKFCGNKIPCSAWKTLFWEPKLCPPRGKVFFVNRNWVVFTGWLVASILKSTICRFYVSPASKSGFTEGLDFQCVNAPGVIISG